MLLERKFTSYALLVTVAFCLETQPDASKAFAESNQGVEPEQTAATHLPGSQSKLEFSDWKIFKGHGDAVRFT